MKKSIICFCWLIVIGVGVHALVKQLNGYTEEVKHVLEYLITIPLMIIVFLKSLNE